jgi:hypothetical protein
MHDRRHSLTSIIDLSGEEKAFPDNSDPKMDSQRPPQYSPAPPPARSSEVRIKAEPNDNEHLGFDAYHFENEEIRGGGADMVSSLFLGHYVCALILIDV